MLRIALGTALAALLLAAPASAAPTTRYVGNPGTGGAPCTDAQHPCVLFTALDAAAAGDTISIRRDPAPYSIAGGLNIDKAVSVVGAAGERPVFQFPNSDGLVISAAGAELRHLRIEASGGATAVNAVARATLTDLDIDSTGPCVRISAPSSMLTDSTLTVSAPGASADCLDTGPAATGLVLRRITAVHAGANGDAISVDGAGVDAADLTVTSADSGISISGGTSPTSAPATLRRTRITSSESTALTVRRDEGGGPLIVSDVVATFNGTGGSSVVTRGAPVLRNVTATASGPNSYGLIVVAQDDSTPAAESVRNSVFRGEMHDIDISDGTPEQTLPGGTVIPATYRTPLTITHSNFRSVQGTLGPGSGNNASGDPLFADASNGNFHPLAGSPLIDAGAADAANGPTDLDGRARTLGAAPDIGAYEFPPPAAPGTTDPGTTDPGLTDPGATDPRTAPADLAPPQLSALALTNRTFAVGSAATAVAARARRPKTGTTFRLTLSEAATVSIAFERSEPGRRSGRKCVKATRKNRKARKCKRWVKRGAIQRAAAAGPVTIPFSGRIGRKALKTGSYRALVTARDAAGNVSQQRTLTFKIVKR